MNVISEKKLESMARFFKALGDVRRLRILLFLKDNEKCQCEIIPLIGLSQPALSRHLQILVDNGLLSLQRSGNRRLYSLTNSAKTILFKEECLATV